ncbi:LysR family transcriptional regulator (plasmid) [Pseudoalteromonas sp. T1lg65]|uniref:LysR family transcriptional regulator n=1 Tax=Pseudoalteromonas sp. T1lg65 TaxID=2077101 RepID=UPI003F792F8E
MKISELYVFRVVVEAQSLASAAMQLHKTQPAVTQTIKRLEQSLGFALFTRDKYRIELTEQGRRFYFQAEQLLEHHRDLSLLAKEFAEGNEPKYKICYEPVCYHPSFDAIIADTFKSFPATEMTITSGKRFVSLEQVNQGIAGLGIGPWFDLFHSMGNLESLPIGDLKLGLVSKPGFMPKEVYFEELADYPSLAMVESEFKFDSERLSYTNSTNTMKLDDVASIKRYLLSGMGCALIALNLCEDELASGQLQQVKVKDRRDEFTAEIHVFRQHKRHHGPVARYLWQQFKRLSDEYQYNAATC